MPVALAWDRGRVALVALGLSAILTTGACGGGARAPEVTGLPDVVDFNFHVKPILSDRCFACHGPDDRARKAGLRLDTQEGPFARLESGNRAVVPGKPGRSALVKRILSTDPEFMMPSPESHLTLSDYEKAILIRWIERGAEWKPHWAFIAPEMPPVPGASDPRWSQNEIDAFILATLGEKGFQPSPEADKETLIRRVTFDLTGLPPTIEEIDGFLADDSPDAYERVVDRLLASPAYGERMAAEWLDVARYADSHGYQDDGMRKMWPWRDWVIDAFNRNMSFDQFITWQLAGDLLPQATQEQLLATGFNRNHMQSQEGGIVLEEYRVEYVADRVNTLGAAFLGVTLECARCHDHKYDPILQKEYYQLFSFFNTVNESGQAPYSGVASPILTLKDEEAERRLAALDEQIRKLEADAAPDNAAFDAGFRAWLERVEATKLGPTIDVAKLPGLVGHLPLDGSQVVEVPAADKDGKPAPKGTPPTKEIRFVNAVNPRKPATLGGDRDRVPETVPGRIGQAQRLPGESHIDLGKEFGFFERNQPFSVGIWFRIEEEGTEGPLFARSAGWANGNRGYEVILRKDGTFTAGLHHVVPDNSIEIETVQAVTPGTWHHLAMTYDGSSRAAGLRLFIDGKPVATRTLMDNLHRSIIQSGIEDNQNWGEPPGLRIGRRSDETLQDVSVDDLRVYDRQLTAFEAAALSGVDDPLGVTVALPPAERSAAQQAALREHYVLRVEPRFPPLLRQLTEARGRANELLTSLPAVMVMGEQPSPRPTFMLARGAYDAPAERVEPDTPKAIGPFPKGLPRNRLGLAQWLLDPGHPLTARVLVNRYWGLLFGNGIVATPEDFGNQGRLPTHPELLDWLAITFIESGWDLKGLHKRMVTSATYRQSSAADARLLERDPANEWLARGPAYRMSAEQIRDNALAASGLLVRRIGGPSVYPYQPPGLWEELATRNATTYVQGEGEDLYRRSLYTVWKRSTPPPSAISFDAADRLICAVRRQRTSTPLQALVLLNDPQYVEAARMVAERMIKDGGSDPDDRITLGFRLLTSRRPQPDERQLLRDLYDEELAHFQTHRQEARSLLSVGEQPRDAKLDAAETAALTVVASTLINLDEAVNKR
jgi:hypothetical protein